MTKINFKRHLSAILITMVSLINTFSLNVTNVLAKKVLVNDGAVDVAETSSGVGEVDIPAISNSIFSSLGFYLQGFAGIALLTLTTAFVIKCGQLAASADNANKRSTQITGLLWIGICIGLLGAFDTIMVILTRFVNGF